jgi:phosphoglycolate phosphatase-like HAD superfamily hydrolase
MLRIITDFDGPIMDVSERYYQVYCYCLEQVRRPEQPITVLSKSEFWALKRSQIPERQIGQKSGLDELQSQEFAHLRKATVHTLPYFQYDVIQPVAMATLAATQQAGVDLAIMTMRRVREVDVAFSRYDLAPFFPENRRYCLSNDYVKTKDVKDKPLLMARALAELPPASETWMIGDTEADIAAAQQHGIPVIGVLSGIRDRTHLAKHHPDHIVANFQEAVSFILEQQSTSRQQIAG